LIDKAEWEEEANVDGVWVVERSKCGRASQCEETKESQGEAEGRDGRKEK
jgi:hypothetical protein